MTTDIHLDQALTAKLNRSIHQIGLENWQACAGNHNPFLDYRFLAALEDAGCVSPDEGWVPYHLSLEDPSGLVVGVAPLYIKTHSQGEYVFDYAWADAYERAGGRYYPKLQCAVPFTPVTGQRLLVRRGQDPAIIRPMLAQSIVGAADQLGVSSLHVTFSEADDLSALKLNNCLERHDRQFHWENNGYSSFDDFLAALNNRKRKNIRKERQKALSDGLTIELQQGDSLTDEAWDAMFHFYMDTGMRKWGRPYLNRDFFQRLHDTMADQVLLIMAKNSRGHYVAGALNLIGKDTLYGRYWGCMEHHPGLHFEVCYYQAIDWAIKSGFQRVEAGAQGEHKLARGYLPSQTQSAHWIKDPGFRKAVADYLDRERQAIALDKEILVEMGPFKKED